MPVDERTALTLDGTKPATPNSTATAVLMRAIPLSIAGTVASCGASVGRTMRQIFSVRFFAAVGAVAALLFVLVTVFTARRVIEGDGAADDAPQLRAIDLVDQVQAASAPITFDADGLTLGSTVLTIDPSRAMTIVPGTPGVDHCGQLATPGACAVVADLLGEGVVWFALVPMGAGRAVPMPAVDTVEEGVATLVNGWQFPHAPAFDRRCGEGADEEVFESYRQFKQLFGENFTTLYDLDQRQLAAVVCRQRVAYAPPPASTVPSTVPSTSAAASPET